MFMKNKKYSTSEFIRIICTILSFCLLVTGCVSEKSSSNMPVSGKESSTSVETSSQEVSDVIPEPVKPQPKMETISVMATIEGQTEYVMATDNIYFGLVDELHFLSRLMFEDYNIKALEESLIKDMLGKEAFFGASPTVHISENIYELPDPATTNYMRINRDDTVIPMEDMIGRLWRDIIYFPDPKDEDLLHILWQSPYDDEKWMPMQFSGYGQWFEKELELYYIRNQESQPENIIEKSDIDYIFNTKKGQHTYLLDNDTMNKSLLESLGYLSSNLKIAHTTRKITQEETDHINQADAFVNEILGSLEDKDLSKYMSGELVKPAQANYLMVNFKDTEHTKNHMKKIIVWCEGENDEDLCMVKFDDVMGDEVSVYKGFGKWFSAEQRFTYRVYG